MPAHKVHLIAEQAKAGRKQVADPRTQKRCYGCGKQGHIVRDCKALERKAHHKCYACRQEGHLYATVRKN